MGGAHLAHDPRLDLAAADEHGDRDGLGRHARERGLEGSRARGCPGHRRDGLVRGAGRGDDGVEHGPRSVNQAAPSRIHRDTIVSFVRRRCTLSRMRTLEPPPDAVVDPAVLRTGSYRGGLPAVDPDAARPRADLPPRPPEELGVRRRRRGRPPDRDRGGRARLRVQRLRLRLRPRRRPHAGRPHLGRPALLGQGREDRRRGVLRRLPDARLPHRLRARDRRAGVPPGGRRARPARHRAPLRDGRASPDRRRSRPSRGAGASSTPPRSACSYRPPWRCTPGAGATPPRAASAASTSPSGGSRAAPPGAGRSPSAARARASGWGSTSSRASWAPRSARCGWRARSSRSPRAWWSSTRTGRSRPGAFRTKDGEVDLRFDPGAMHEEKRNLVVVALQLRPAGGELLRHDPRPGARAARARRGAGAWWRISA